MSTIQVDDRSTSEENKDDILIVSLSRFQSLTKSVPRALFLIRQLSGYRGAPISGLRFYVSSRGFLVRMWRVIGPGDWRVTSAW